MGRPGSHDAALSRDGTGIRRELQASCCDGACRRRVGIPPIGRTDDAFYAPLENLRLSSETELYLGLVHAQDGVEGTRRRIETAKKHAPAFGIASECGISRGRDPNMALAFIKTYAAAAAVV